MADPEEILTKANLSKKTLIWILSIAFSIIVALCAFIYEKVLNNDSSEQIIILTNDISDLKSALKSTQDDLIEVENKNSDALENMKLSFDKKLDFIVANSDSKRKEFMQSVLDLTKDQVIVKQLPDEKIVKHDTVFVNKYETRFIREVKEIVIPDTAKKESIIKKGIKLVKFW